MLIRILRTPWPWLAAAALLVALYFLAPIRGEKRSGDPRPPGDVEDIVALAGRDDINLLFVLIDTLRADRTSAYGYSRRTSPLLDALAATGVRFDRHLSQSSWTKCSMASLWTGLYPQHSGVTRYEHVLPDVARMPAEILHDAGFRTAGIFRNGWVEGYFGFGQGFEIYMRPPHQFLSASVRRENPTLKEVGSDTDAVEAAVEFLRVYGHERWFLYMHLMDVHEYVYDEESAVFGTAYSDVYDQAILRVNRVLNQWIGHLAESGFLENTVIVIASDHGEAFGERGLEGHARYVYRETQEVPLIISFPFRLAEPVVVRERTRNVDLWPTLLDLLGLPPLEPSDGRSRLPEILAAARGEGLPEAAGAETPSIAHLDQSWGRRGVPPAPTVAVSDGGLRYVLYRDARGKIREELYDRSHDRLEVEDVLQERPEKAARLREIATTYLSGESAWEGGNPTLELNEMQLNQLRALGYQVP